MAMVILRSFIFATTLVLAYSWKLEVSHDSIIPDVTTDVILRCFDDRNLSNQSDGFVDPVTRVRLLKHRASSKSWFTFAEIVVPYTSEVKLTQADMSHVTPSGHLGDTGNSFLQLDWSVASQKSVGRYKCEVDGFLAKDHTDFHAITSEINITSLITDSTSSSQLVIMKQLITKTMEMAVRMEKMEAQHRIEIDNLKKEIGNALAMNASAIWLSQIERVKALIRENYLEARLWPEGNYSLIAPTDGCPNSTFTSMTPGSITIMYKTSSSPLSGISPNGHLSKSFFSRHSSVNTLVFSYCNKTSPAFGINLPWPPGSYCIRPPSSRKCPRGFSLGDINFYLKQSATINIIAVDAPYLYPLSKNGIDFSYCCRDDRGPEIPIFLPTATPFYLYRYKGTCQTVYNMDVTEEWFKVGTDPNANDRYDYAPVHPDGSLNDVLVHLCYYKKKLILTDPNKYCNMP